uniref:H(+)/Pi cotransporter n=1 Tax=Oryza brachyantha TaxID=4533 RepID=J3L830_ORYBR
MEFVLAQLLASLRLREPLRCRVISVYGYINYHVYNDHNFYMIGYLDKHYNKSSSTTSVKSVCVIAIVHHSPAMTTGGNRGERQVTIYKGTQSPREWSPFHGDVFVEYSSVVLAELGDDVPALDLTEDVAGTTAAVAQPEEEEEASARSGDGAAASSSSSGGPGNQPPTAADLAQLFFGWLGDKLGRKSVYGMTLVMMVICSVASGLSFSNTPTSVMATLCYFRFWLGFGIGDDYPLSATIMSEYANKKTRGAFVAEALLSKCRYYRCTRNV